MNEDYLWDRSGDPDPEIARLEKLLGPLRGDALPLEMERLSRESRRSGLLVRWGAVAAALLIIVAGTAGWSVSRQQQRWELVSLDSGTRLRTGVERGAEIRTDDSTRLQLRMGLIGEVTIDPSTRLRILRTALRESRIGLDEGTIHARILAPPRLFFVSVPSGEAIDLGCAYSLAVSAGGEAVLRVTAGMVALDGDEGTVYVPRGAEATLSHRGVPGIPRYQDADPRFIEAIDQWSGDRRGLEDLLALARPRDRMTLWHLLRNGSPDQRRLIAERIAELEPLPPGMTVDRLAGGDRETVDRLGEDFGIRPSSRLGSWMRAGWRALTSGPWIERPLRLSGIPRRIAS
ncbi:MAG TPA: hypothetical protein VM534_01855 [Thermoanaerobaculia bacterium]|nr:hypothetical protein [Thermoanaerobaculia bacterium]